jgi:hypothetical protein
MLLLQLPKKELVMFLLGKKKLWKNIGGVQSKH